MMCTPMTARDGPHRLSGTRAPSHHPRTRATDLIHHPRPARTATPHHKLRVQIIEPNPVLRRRHTAFIERTQDFEMEQSTGCITTGATHLSAHEGATQLLLLGLADSSDPGLQLLRHIRAQARSLPVVVMSAQPTAHLVHHCLALGVLDFIVTPITYGAFEHRVHQLKDFCLTHAQAQQATAETSSTLEQTQVDRLLTAQHPRNWRSQPGGYAPETLRLVRTALTTADHATAQDIANRTHLSRVTARRYLEQLVTLGVAQRSPHHGSTGRPVSMYRILM